MLTMPRPVEITPHTAIGVSLALLGVVLTLDNLGFVEAGAVIRFWPLIPMLVGTAYIVQGREIREWGIGAAWLLVGTAFLLRNLDVFHFDLVDFLPLILVAVGVKVIFARHRHHQAARRPGMPDPAQPAVPAVPPAFAPAAEEAFPPRFPWPPGQAPGTAAGTAAGAPAAGVRGQIIRVFAILWGADRRARGPIAHVEVSAIMGGCDVDLRDAVPTVEPIAIQVFAMWGGIDIRIPPGWVVEIEAWPILGGVVDNTQAPALPAHRVILRGMAFMGGVEIKN
jgi:Domain of unknown function (DUF5668)